MCNLYSITTVREAVLRLFNVGDNRAAEFEPLAAVFPGQVAPVVRRATDGEPELSMLSWGFVLPQEAKAAKRITNARDDKVLDSRFWRGSLQERRCLVPVTSFAEPRGKPAVWHWFALDESRPLFAFAGLWRSFRGRLKADGPFVEIETYAIVTTQPNEVVRPIHPTRMPVMLTSETDREVWMNGSVKEALSLARPYPDDGMRIVYSGDKEDVAVPVRTQAIVNLSS